MLGQIQMIYSDINKGQTNKIGRINVVGDDDMEMADKVVYENMHSTTSRSRSRIQST